MDAVVEEQLSLPLDNRVRVEELMRTHQDIELLYLAREYAANVDLNEWVDEEELLLSCISIRRDAERKNLNCFIAYQGNEAVGFLVGAAARPFHRKGVVAELRLWYIAAHARGGIAAKLLVRAFERWARINGATRLLTGTANIRHSERASKLLEHLGYARVGSLHVKEI